MNNKDKIILDLCGGTGSWSKPYKDAGYTVINITLPKYNIKTYHPPKNVYGILAAPPCTEFSFAKTNSKYPRKMKEGIKLIYHCLRIIWECQYYLPTPLAKTTNLKFWALENPFGLLRRYLGHPVMIFNPYDFGDAYQKKTCLWGYFNIPIKKPIKCNKPKFDKLLTNEIHNEYYGKLTRQERRAITPSGFAKAFYNANK